MGATRDLRAAVSALAALATVLQFAACARRPVQAQAERLAVLRFENLGADGTADWIGRAIPEVMVAELAGVPGLYALRPERLHNLDAATGARPSPAPGISSERTLAILSGANRIGYGEYSVRGNRLEARLSIEDPQTLRMTRVITASGAAGDVLAVASALARQVSAKAGSYETHSREALRAYMTALESRDAASMTSSLDAAVAADPAFGPPYLQLARVKAGQGDREGALNVLDRGLARGGALSILERARMEFEAAQLRRDAAGRQRALETLAKVDPGDPAVWRALAETQMAARLYREAAQAFRKALDIEPEDVNTLNQLGYASAHAGDLDGAVQALRRYQALRPAEANPLDSLGDVHMITGHLREAEGFYQQVAAKDPNFLAGSGWFKAAMARLMTGDVAGADAFARQYLDGRAAAHDPVVAYRRAQWSWAAGRRRAACGELEAFAKTVEGGPLKDVAARAYAELALWKLVLGDRGVAGRLAEKAAALAGPSSAPFARLAAFWTQPPATPSEWALRAERLSPSDVPGALKNVALAYALLLDRHFQPAALLLKELYATPSPGLDEGLPVVLAWAYMESGRFQDADSLLRSNPVPPTGGLSLFTPFYFPRLYYLRAVEAEKQGRQEDARADNRVFLQLSGPDPLIWGEEQKARLSAGSAGPSGH